MQKSTHKNIIKCLVKKSRENVLQVKFVNHWFYRVRERKENTHPSGMIFPLHTHTKTHTHTSYTPRNISIEFHFWVFIPWISLIYKCNLTKTNNETNKPTAWSYLNDLKNNKTINAFCMCVNSFYKCFI